MNLTITSIAQDGYHLIALTGDVDTKTAPELFNVLTALELATVRELRIEMAKVGFMSSAGLRALVFAKQKMPHEGRLVLIGTNTEITEVIMKTGLNNAVTIIASHDEL